MKVRINMKTPDALDTAAQTVAEEYDEEAAQTFLTSAKRWFKYGETATVEIDTEAQTATVLEVK